MNFLSKKLYKIKEIVYFGKNELLNINIKINFEKIKIFNQYI